MGVWVVLFYQFLCSRLVRMLSSVCLGYYFLSYRQHHLLMVILVSNSRHLFIITFHGSGHIYLQDICYGDSILTAENISYHPDMGYLLFVFYLNWPLDHIPAVSVLLSKILVSIYDIYCILTIFATQISYLPLFVLQ